MDVDFSNLPVDGLHHIGPYKANKESDPRTIVKFSNYADRERVWAKNYPHQIERRPKKLWPYLRAARAGDPNHPENRVTAHLRVDKLIINSRAFS